MVDDAIVSEVCRPHEISDLAFERSGKNLGDCLTKDKSLAHMQQQKLLTLGEIELAVERSIFKDFQTTRENNSRVEIKSCTSVSLSIFCYEPFI
jgi:hypothetical protein